MLQCCHVATTWKHVNMETYQLGNMSTRKHVTRSRKSLYSKNNMLLQTSKETPRYLLRQAILKVNLSEILLDFIVYAVHAGSNILLEIMFLANCCLVPSV